MRGRKNLPWISLVMALLVNMALMGVARAQITTLAAPTVMNTALTPGSTFSIDITVADVTAMWGYDLTLEYDTTVLTATGFASYPPFTIPWPSEINDTAGWVKASYSMTFGEPVGFSTVDPAPILRIDFHVDALGWSFLDMYDTEISDIYGEPITPHEVVDGFFANIEPQYMCNLVRKSAWPEHHHWVESKDPDQTLYALARNIGTLPTTAYVVFTVHNDDALWQATFTTDTVLLVPKQILKLDKTITPADLTGYGKYYVKAQCWYDDGTGTYVPGTKLKSFAFALVP